MKPQLEPNERDRHPSVIQRTGANRSTNGFRSRNESPDRMEVRQLKSDILKLQRENEELSNSIKEIDSERNLLLKEIKKLGPLAFIGVCALTYGLLLVFKILVNGEYYQFTRIN
ncbi:16612_t:CDS:2 [Acaulospora morrowiae]|uniref:16612_t:CDS:1 n=1 Tax=Acaulospora morrowiae TaxID=94023 RepID=A0A9N9EH42_9GLOM|nr:16612_t:CDS:2 [Acaulospora morrowiae]